MSPLRRTHRWTTSTTEDQDTVSTSIDGAETIRPVFVTTAANVGGEDRDTVDTVTTSDDTGETCTQSFSETEEDSTTVGEKLKPHRLDTVSISTVADETDTRVCVDTIEKIPVVLVRDTDSKFRHELEKIRNNESGECTKFQVEFERNMETRLEELTVVFREHKDTNENQIGELTNRLHQASTEEKEERQVGKSQNAE